MRKDVLMARRHAARIRGRLGSRVSRFAVMLLAIVMALSSAACGRQDDRTVVSVWSWEPSMASLIEKFEKANPDIRIDLTETSGYDKLNSAIQNGYGTPDVVQLEYSVLPQYAVSGQLVDITDRTRGMSSFFTPGTWSSVGINDEVYGLPLDSGPMAFFYNKSVFDAAGVDATKIRTWDDYYRAAKKLKKIGVYIAADSGDASFFNSMVWLAGGRPFRTSKDGRTVSISLTSDKGTKSFATFWQKMIDDGLIATNLTEWSDSWKKAVGEGTVASIFSGAWLPSLLLSDVTGASGLWRVKTMPTKDGSTTNSEEGGSALAILKSSRKPDAAYRFIAYVCHSSEGIGTRVASGSFPADVRTLSDPEFLNRTTILDSRGIGVDYFGGQKFNKVLAEAASEVSVGYQYLPFEVYSRNDFASTVRKAYVWSTGKARFDDAVARIMAGGVKDGGGTVTVPEFPGQKVSLMDGVELWQKDLLEYGGNQGFTVE